MKLAEAPSIFTALADPTRLRILNLLGEGELCVCDLMKVLRQPQSKISRHLGYLRRSGWVLSRKEGLWMHYRLSESAGIHRSLSKVLRDGRAIFPEFRQDLKALESNRNCLVGCCE